MKKYDVICMGTALVDSIIKGFDPNPVSASGYRSESGVLSLGGEALNESMAAAKLSLKTGLVCAVGEDAAGDMIIAGVKKAGVDPELIIHLKDYSTPVSTIFVHEDGTRKSITNRSHKYNFHPEKYTSLYMDARALVLGSLFRAPFDDPTIIRMVLEAVKKSDAIVFADTKLPNFRVLSLEDIADSLPLIDYLTPNEDEARYFSGKEDPEEMADVFLDMGIKNIIIKLGSKGCLFKNNNETIRLRAYKTDAVDATGAGDNFLAGFVSEILRGKPHKEALCFANACGAICTTKIGAGSALENRDQVKKWIEEFN
ncbi:MAG: carbohydrate kinase family protein [Lachnospiraceae bacterium]|nr:carbohydrate kinase family protein [Lachnospiraceae bacterium]